MTQETSSIFAYILLISNPFLGATSDILKRSMRNLNEMTSASWGNLSQMTVFISIAYFSGQDLSIWRDFSIIDWLALLTMSGGLVLA